MPDGNLKLVTYHDAYAYFAKTFGWDVVGAVQPKNFEDPTPQEVARIIDQVEAEGVTDDLRLGGLPLRRARGDRHAPPAPGTRTRCATTTCPASPERPSTPGSG